MKKNKLFRVLMHAGFFLLFISLLACSKKETIVEERFPDGSEKIVKTYKVKGDDKSLIKEIRFYANGKKEFEGEYKNNLKHGEWTYWYKNGFVWSEGFFHEGKSDGIRKVYHENGQLYYEGEYDKGKAIGTWIFYDENGNEIKKESY